MNTKITPIATAIFFLLGSESYASGGAAGNNGISQAANGDSIDLIGSLSIGAPGSTDNGRAGLDTSPKNIDLSDKDILGIAAGNGFDGSGNGSWNSGGGGGGSGGHGGAAVIGGLSQGGAGGDGNSARGGAAGNVHGNTLSINASSLKGASGGHGGFATDGGAGTGGFGGGSIFGGISLGGSGGFSYGANNYADGGKGGGVSNNTISIIDSTLTGSIGGDGGKMASASSQGGAGIGGHGGGSVFGGISQGGSAGTAYLSANGGSGGDVSDNVITITGKALIGEAGGEGGLTPSGGAGAGGHGGGSVFGGISLGGAGGDTFDNQGLSTNSASYANGGSGGNVTRNTISITGLTLTGAKGGDGGHVRSSSTALGGAGAGGHGGGSVFGGISQGAAGGYSDSLGFANGGNGGNVTHNTIIIESSKLQIPTQSTSAGNGGAAPAGGDGLAGYNGGSVFGGISQGGSGGTAGNANGGNGGNVTNNKITLSGNTFIEGDVYGGISRGGAIDPYRQSSKNGQGGLTNNNTLTIIGNNLSIEGSLYGGISINGNLQENLDETYIEHYKNNTINIQSGEFHLKGSIRNFQNYNWLVPKNNFNNQVIINVNQTGQAVNLNHTIHRVDVEAQGNELHAGNKIILIDKVSGDFDREGSAPYLEQGFFIIYDAKMDIENINGNNALTLTVQGENDGIPDGKAHPEAEELLKGRIAQLAFIDQGADMISDGISYARASLRKENENIFTIIEGGTNKYKNGGASTLKLDDFKFAVGAAKAIEFDNKSVGMVAAFAEHGNGNYSSYNYFDYFGDTRGSGKLRYSGVGLMLHMDVAGTDVSKVQNKPNIFDDKYGLYVDAALRIGHIKVDFHSADMANGKGVEANYKTKSRYASAMAGVGYVWTLDEKQAVDLYGRFTFSRLNGKDIQVVDEQMHAGAAHSKRMRLGARYGYIYSDKVTPYAGVAFERNFTGDVTGSAYGFTIKETSLKGNTGIVEAGVMVKPKGAQDPFSMHLGVQAAFGQRKGVSAGVRARYVF